MRSCVAVIIPCNCTAGASSEDQTPEMAMDSVDCEFAIGKKTIAVRAQVSLSSLIRSWDNHVIDVHFVSVKMPRCVSTRSICTNIAIAIAIATAGRPCLDHGAPGLALGDTENGGSTPCGWPFNGPADGIGRRSSSSMMRARSQKALERQILAVSLAPLCTAAAAAASPALGRPEASHASIGCAEVSHLARQVARACSGVA